MSACRHWESDIWHREALSSPYHYRNSSGGEIANVNVLTTTL